MSKRPAFQFYPSDWRKEPGLRLCSMAARGLWIEMMCLMHECVPYGHLTVKGRAMRPDELARVIGESPTQVKRWLGELEEHEVYSVAEGGVLYSRRMVRDEQIREARASGGHKGAEHGSKGAAHGIKGGRPKSEKPPFDDHGRGVSEPPPSSSSSSADYSEADASAACAARPASPLDLKAGVFTAGVDYLIGAGVPNTRARQMLGKWRRDFGDPKLIDALAAAHAEAVSDPVPWITARLGGAPARGGRNQGSWLDA